MTSEVDGPGLTRTGPPAPAARRFRIFLQNPASVADTSTKRCMLAPGGVTVALQGTLETFSVPEVLRLLSGTGKTGLLALEGDRGAGNVWLPTGARPGPVRPRADRHIDAVLFDLLRFADGEFVFEPDAEADDADRRMSRSKRRSSGPSAAEEWREIESVVPVARTSACAWSSELGDDSVTVTAEQWRSLVAIGGGTTAAGLGVHHRLGEFDACPPRPRPRRGPLVEVDRETVEPADAPDRSETADEAYPSPTWYDDDRPLVDNDLSTDEVASSGQNLASFVARGPDDDAGDDRRPRCRRPGCRRPGDRPGRVRRPSGPTTRTTPSTPTPTTLATDDAAPTTLAPTTQATPTTRQRPRRATSRKRHRASSSASWRA